MYWTIINIHHTWYSCVFRITISFHRVIQGVFSVLFNFSVSTDLACVCIKRKLANLTVGDYREMEPWETWCNLFIFMCVRFRCPSILFRIGQFVVFPSNAVSSVVSLRFCNEFWCFHTLSCQISANSGQHIDSGYAKNAGFKGKSILNTYFKHGIQLFGNQKQQHCDKNCISAYYQSSEKNNLQKRKIITSLA